MGSIKQDMFSSISQIGVVVRDMGRFAKNMEALIGAKPLNIIEFPNASMKNHERYYYGNEADFIALLGFFKIGNLEIEAIQPLSGKNIWTDFLDEKGEGIHHIRFSVDNLKKTEKHLKKMGIEKAQNGYSTRNIDGLQWAYYDTRKELGFFIEVFNEYESKK
ncbi:MAG: VOC family protein [Eubacteriales bacterium]|nr:VOC family protein [Eubacteriales bacterium]